MPEEETFAVLVKLMQDYRLREMFKPTMAELGLYMYQLENLVQVSNHSHSPSAFTKLCPVIVIKILFCSTGASPRSPHSFLVTKFSYQHVCK